MAFSGGGSGLFNGVAQQVQADVDDRMLIAMEEIKEKHRLADIAKEEARKEALTNHTGNKNAKVYINPVLRKKHVGGAGTAETMREAEAAAEESDDSDAEYLKDDPELERLRLARVKAMKAMQEDRIKKKALGFGEYLEIVEPEFLKEVTSLKHVVCHFFHDEFARCKVTDQKLQLICRVFPQIKFIKLNAQKAPFMVQKLNIRTLPTIVSFVDGIAKDRIIGFEGLGGVDTFKTRILEMRLLAGFEQHGEHFDQSQFEQYPDDIVEEEFEDDFEGLDQ